MTFKSRSFLGLSAITLTALLASLMSGSTVASAGEHHAAARSLAGDHPVLGPPMGRATPATAAPDLTPGEKSPWTPLKNAPAFHPGTMLLASDGTVLVHSEPSSGGTSVWYKLTPDSSGSYIDGTWSQIASMPSGYDPLYFASAILPNGQMIVEGGEYLGGDDAWTNKGAVYNPVTNTWRRVAPPPGWTNIGDAQSDLLANGTFMLSQACQNCLSSNPQFSTSDALFNATGLNWTVLSGQGKNDPNDEEGWTLEPSGQLLTIDTWLTPTTELFTPTSLTWSDAGNTVTSPVDSPANEIGPQVEMPGGNTFVVGAGTSSEIAPAACTTHRPAPTALYDYAARRWVKGPVIPTIGGLQYDSADGPGSILPDGNVLFDVSPCVYNAPIAFFLYHASSNTLTPVPDVPNAANDSTYYTRLLALPNGQVLFGDGSRRMEVYTTGGTANPAWRPSLTGLSSFSLTPGHTASLSGTQLAGLDQGAAYGDDVQDNTNFPLVRITNAKSGVVTYARTSRWSSVSVAPGAASSANFTVPAGTQAGTSTLVVVANGIASSPVRVVIR
ncbi:MAG TPA: hypothetical protein VHY58_03050 [Streptosporangiaceae bacterium]|jgi:hypothetical protein|nr:hypothetical protein [Streptosporangiaceae bacterium]